MNTEINLLEKTPNKFAPYLKLGIVFVMLVLCVLAFILFQKSTYQSQIETQSNKLAQLENTLKKHQETVVNKQEQERLITDIHSIKSTHIPSVDVYKSIIGLLPDAKKLVMYEALSSNQIIVGVQFETLLDVAAYVSLLVEQNYITGTELSAVNFTRPTYQATLTVTVDPDTLVKEFGEND